MCIPGGSDSKESAYKAGDPGFIPGSGRSPGVGNGTLLYYSCLENSVDKGAWRATFHGVTKSQTRLCDFTFTIYLVVSGLSCGMQDVCCITWSLLLWHMGSLVVVHGFSYSYSMWNLSSLTRNQTCVLCITRWMLNHWNISGREVLINIFSSRKNE